MTSSVTPPAPAPRWAVGGNTVHRVDEPLFLPTLPMVLNGCA
ncbi:hypothetical protein ABZS71_02910 [Streptomyces sp. NPDC005393]